MYALGLNTIDSVESIPGLFISNISTASSPELLIKYGIGHILSLTGFQEFSDRPHIAEALGIETLQIDIEDSPHEDLLMSLDGLCAWIEDAIATGQGRAGVLVHCIQGISRSGAVVVAYLMRTHKIGYYDALHIAQRSRHPVRPNSGFANQLRLWEELGYTIFVEATLNNARKKTPEVKQEYRIWKENNDLLLPRDMVARQERTREVMIELFMQFQRKKLHQEESQSEYPSDCLH